MKLYTKSTLLIAVLAVAGEALFAQPTMACPTCMMAHPTQSTAAQSADLVIDDGDDDVL